ncbi:MAG: PilZ domain-containing protein [Hyphomicrobiaceae bacterium]
MNNIIRLPLRGAPVSNWSERLFVPDQGTESHLLVGFVNEVISTALWVAVTTGIVNRCYLHNMPTALSFLRGSIPPNPVLFTALKREMDEDRRVERLIDRCEEFFTCLGAARNLLLAEFRPEEAFRRSSDIESYRLCDMWQATAGAGLLALYEIDGSEFLSAAAGTPDRIADVCDALILARDGGQPFQDNGVPAIPEWAEQRLSRRFLLNMPAFLTCQGRRSDVMVLNISGSGMGLDFVKDARSGDLVSVELQNGRRFIGTIVWVQCNHAGLRFRRALRLTDPLLGMA